MTFSTVENMPIKWYWSWTEIARKVVRKVDRIVTEKWIRSGLWTDTNVDRLTDCK